jgi:serine/threonine-protein kinase
VHDQPEALARAAPSIPAEMETVVMDALAKDPEARHPTASAFRQAITDAAGGEVTEPLGSGDTAVLPAADTETLGPPPPTRRWLVPVAILGAVLLVGGVVALAMAGDDEEPRRQRRERQQRAERSPTPSVETTVPAILGVDDAAAAFQQLVAVSLEAGLLSEEVAREALEDQGDALNAYAAGDQEEALFHLDDADADIESALSEGAIASPDAATSLHEGIDAIRQAMLAAPASPIEEIPAEEEDGEEESCEDLGPGNSGCAPGHSKDDDEGEDDD